jgi:hypothetical protein
MLPGCSPNCENRNCGPDGCGGWCGGGDGTCPGEYECLPAGICTPCPFAGLVSLLPRPLHSRGVLWVRFQAVTVIAVAASVARMAAAALVVTTTVAAMQGKCATRISVVRGLMCSQHRCITCKSTPVVLVQSRIKHPRRRRPSRPLRPVYPSHGPLPLLHTRLST